MAGQITPLEGALIVRKGLATPTGSRAETPVGSTVVSVASGRIGGARRSGTIAITVRLDPDRYQRLKSAGLEHGLTNQEIMVAALDNWFRGQNPA
jgi:hypothetical protein